jgi:hypothetical protein
MQIKARYLAKPPIKGIMQNPAWMRITLGFGMLSLLCRHHHHHHHHHHHLHHLTHHQYRHHHRRHHPPHHFHHHLSHHIHHRIPHSKYTSPVLVIVKITCHIDNGICKPHNSARTQDAAIEFQDASAGAPVLWIATAHIV